MILGHQTQPPNAKGPLIDARAARADTERVITEFDVRDDTFPDDIATRDALIADTAETFLNAVLRVPAVKAVITWELADSYSFYTDAAKKKNPQAERLPRPLPFDDAMQKKPLWYAMARAFRAAKRV